MSDKNRISPHNINTKSIRLDENQEKYQSGDY